MTPERYHRINQIFHEALAQAGEDREDFLDQVCDGDPVLRLEVERMLVAQQRAGDFLDAPAFDAFTNSLIDEQSGGRLIGRVIGQYRILAKLGEGGMGEVFLAHDTRLERRVALKLLPQGVTSDGDRLRRFDREARAASALNHPNIVTIHEVGQAQIEGGALYFIAQEFIEGQTLRRRIEEGALPLLDALDVAIQAAGALAAAHAAEIAHRDIKPENIMLRPDGFIKILDFGLAKLLGPGQSGFETETAGVTSAILRETAPGTILGTAAYMSPEQARGLEIDARSDIWSLGVVLYEMLAGRAPFRGETIMDVIVSIIDREPPRLSNSLPEAPRELERMMSRALAKSRDERYQTIKALGADLKKLKQRLEFEAELTRSSRPAAADEPQLRTEEQTARQTAAGRTPGIRSRVQPSLRRVLLIAAIPLLAAGIWFFARLSFHPESSISTQAPGRQLTYWLTVQKMSNGREEGESFESTGQGVFESGWKFRINGASPQPGHFYLLNEGPITGGAIGYRLLFPLPSINNGSAQMAANQPIQTGWYVLGERKGIERLWIIWAAQAVGELEAVKGAVNLKDKGLIDDQNQLDAIRKLLNRYSQASPEINTDRNNGRINIKSRAELLLRPVELTHR